jgi:hypothetical protein
MIPNERERQPVEEPSAELERRLINEYLAAAGHDLASLLARHDDEAKKILTDASFYASCKLVEVESRSHYVHNLHGEP